MSRAHLIGVSNLKGGVGKTFTTFNLACDLKRDGKKVLVIDSDPQANLSLAFGYDLEEEEEICLGEEEFFKIASEMNIDLDSLSNDEYDKLYDKLDAQYISEQNVGMTLSFTDLYKNAIAGKAINPHEFIVETDLGVDLIPSESSLFGIDSELINVFMRECILRDKILKLIANDYDYIIIDCPPSLSLLTINTFVAVDEVLIPMQTSKFGLKGLKLLKSCMEDIKALNPELKTNGILFTMVSSGTRFARGLIRRVKKIYGEETYVYTTQISRTIMAEEAIAENLPMTEYEPHSKIANECLLFKNEFIDRVERG